MSDHLEEVIFPAILLELGPPPLAHEVPVGSSGTHNRTHSPKGLGGGGLRESTRVGGKYGAPPMPEFEYYVDTPLVKYWRDVEGLFKYRYNCEGPAPLDEFRTWLGSYEKTSRASAAG